MEDLAGEEVTRVINLNSVPLMQNKQHKKTHEFFHFREGTGIKIAGKEGGVQECKECHKILPLTAFTTHTPRSDGAYHLRKICRECHTPREAERRIVTKNAPPKSDLCKCCHKNKKLQIDHIHGTTVFRGWVCRNCNTGIGGLGDDLEGVLRGAIYLEKDKSKIIEVLNKIKNEKT
jgi:hypothetical protein